MDNLSTGEWVFIGAWVVLILLLLPGLLMEYRGRFTTAISHIAIWGLLFLGAISLYAFRDEFRMFATRVSGELSPYGSQVTASAPEGQRAVRIRKSGSGSFFARVNVNGAIIPMVVDTGASMVVLKAGDAERAGLRLSELSFNVQVSTANGTTYCAPARIRSIAVGEIAFENVDVLVAKPGNLKESLLGMSFLSRLRGYDVSGQFMTFRS